MRGSIFTLYICGGDGKITKNKKSSQKESNFSPVCIF